PVAIAVDGGNSKTDLALVDANGDVLALVRGGNSSPHHLGLRGSLEVLDALRLEALERAALNGDSPAAAALFMAGVDLPSEQAEGGEELQKRRGGAALGVQDDNVAVPPRRPQRGGGGAVTLPA